MKNNSLLCFAIMAGCNSRYPRSPPLTRVSRRLTTLK